MNVELVYTGIDHPNHIAALDAFALGIEANGDTVVTEDPDLYVIFGSWKDRDQPHHNAKRAVVESGQPFVVIETPIFGRKPVKDYIQDDCFRVGLNGFLANTGKFVPDNFEPDTDRLDMMVERLGVKVEPLKGPQHNRGPVVLALQLPGDASLQGQDISQWFSGWVDRLALMHDDKICRFPQLPRDYDRSALNKADDAGWRFQQGSFDDLFDTIKLARLTVSFSSGFGVDSLIAGTPCIVDSPASFAYEISNRGLHPNFSKPHYVTEEERTKWLSKLAYHQWFIDEMESGECWNHIKNLM